MPDLNDIHSNRACNCARCGRLITPHSDSGWEVFVSGGKETQPICIVCDLAEQERGAMPKAESHGTASTH